MHIVIIVIYNPMKCSHEIDSNNVFLTIPGMFNFSCKKYTINNKLINLYSTLQGMCEEFCKN